MIFKLNEIVDLVKNKIFDLFSTFHAQTKIGDFLSGKLKMYLLKF